MKGKISGMKNKLDKVNNNNNSKTLLHWKIIDTENIVEKRKTKWRRKSEGEKNLQSTNDLWEASNCSAYVLQSSGKVGREAHKKSKEIAADIFPNLKKTMTSQTIEAQ